MNKLALQLTLLATALACLLPAGSAQAQIRVFVSQTGADTNPRATRSLTMVANSSRWPYASHEVRAGSP